MRHIRPDNTAIRALASLALLLAGCSPSVTAKPTGPSATFAASAVPSLNVPSPTPTAVAVATAEATIAACVPNPTDAGPALAGIVELRPAGWTMLSNGVGVPGFASVQWSVYGPAGPEVPREEGPGRLVLYEAWPPSDAYFEQRVATSQKAGGEGIDVTVCGDRTELWTSSSTGEILVGWTYRGKSDVLVANVADYTAEQLVQSAERVYDCCG
jgi:hypothetical protein